VKKIFINDESFDGEHVKFGGFKTSMKDGENTCFETMTDTEKQAFIRAKAEEQLVKMEAKEAVIDKLLL
jgi:hypothetical protein